MGTELGRLAYWLIWLVGLIAALQPLGLSGVLTPVTSLTNEVFAFLPRLLGAGLFFFAGHGRASAGARLLRALEFGYEVREARADVGEQLLARELDRHHRQRVARLPNRPVPNS